MSEISEYVSSYQEAVKARSNGKFDSAIKVLQTGAKSNQLDYRGCELLGRLYLQKKEYLNALCSFENALEFHPKSAKCYEGIGQSYALLNESCKSEKYYREAIELNQNFIAAYLGLCEVLLQHECYLEAEDVLKAGLDRNSNNVDHPHFERLVTLLGYVYYVRGDVECYANLRREWLKRFPANSEDCEKLARYYVTLYSSDLIALISNLEYLVKYSVNAPFSTYDQLSQAYRKNNQVGLARQCLRHAPATKKDKQYKKIWEELSCADVNTHEVESLARTIGNSSARAAEEYFTKVSDYLVVDIRSKENLEKNIHELNVLGISIEYLRKNIESVDSDFQCESKTQIEKHPAAKRAARTSKYQTDVLKSDGGVCVICPITGETRVSNLSFPSGPDSVFYRYTSNEEVFYLVTGRPSLAFPKLCFFFPSRDLILVLHAMPLRAERGFSVFKSDFVSNAIAVSNYINCDRPKEKTLLITYNQFAHHLWNELSGLQKLVDLKLQSHVDSVLVAYQPLGEIKSFFPELETSVFRYSDKNMILSNVLKNNLFTFRVGGVEISNELVERVKQSAISRCDKKVIDETKRVRKHHDTLVLISIRCDKRTLSNQLSVLTEVICKLAVDFPGVGVILDGFCLPGESTAVLTGPVQNTLVKEKELAESIIRDCLKIHPDLRIYNTIGCMLYESIAWTDVVDSYLCHHGTIQHKIGWFGNVPGVVHTNEKTLEKRVSDFPAIWAREDCVVPNYVTKQHINSSESVVSLFDGRNNLDNYSISSTVLYSELKNSVLECKKRNS